MTLGSTILGEGHAEVQAEARLKDFLDRLTVASMKPQQMMWAMRVKVFANTNYELVLGPATLKYLIMIDRVIRLYVRKWLFLPHE